jgi:hypothetical protein
MNKPSLLRTFALTASLAAGCASTTAATGNATGAASGAMSGMENGAASALAAKIGIDSKYVTMALDAAKSAYSGGAQTADAKTAAVQSGVDKAATQAQADGKAFTDEQKGGLTTGLAELLK